MHTVSHRFCKFEWKVGNAFRAKPSPAHTENRRNRLSVQRCTCMRATVRSETYKVNWLMGGSRSRHCVLQVMKQYSLPIHPPKIEVKSVFLSRKESLMTLTARERAMLWWFIGLGMAFIAFSQWSSHRAILGFLSLLVACCTMVEAVRIHLRPRPFILSPARILIMCIVCFLPSIIIVGVLFYSRTFLFTIEEICYLFLSLLWLGTGIWLAFRYFSFQRKELK